MASEELGGIVVDIAEIVALHAAAVMGVVVVPVSTACAASAAVVH